MTSTSPAAAVQHRDRLPYDARLGIGCFENRTGNRARDTALIQGIRSRPAQIAQPAKSFEDSGCEPRQLEHAEGLGIQPAKRGFRHTMLRHYERAETLIPQ
jgi:hypothetical protein